MTTSGNTASTRWVDRVLIGVLIGSLAVITIAILAWQIPLGAQVQIEPGEVAPYDVVSPGTITYSSQILTDAARQRAADVVPDQYDIAEGRIRRQQVARAREILEFIDIVLDDPFANPPLQTDYLLAIPDLDLTSETVLELLSLSEAEWQQVSEEVPLALDRIMRDEIRDSTLPAARRRVPGLINTDLSEQSSIVAAELVRGLVRPNSTFNQERTEALREEARAAVPVQNATLVAGEVIIRAGDIATPEDVEALAQIGLLQSEWDLWTVIRAVLMTVAVFTVTGMALYRLRPSTLSSVQELAIVTVVWSVWLLAAKFMVIPHDWLPYLFPLAALGMVITVLIDLRVALMVSLAFMLLVQFLGGANTAIVVYVGVGTLVGTFLLGRAERLTSFLWAGVAVSLANLVSLAAFRVPFAQLATGDLVQLHLVIALNGGLSASIALILYFVIGNVFGITTSLQLTELSRPTHPLLRQLLLKSPGTYHHTIVVSNLAERAAATIGADAFLTRVGAYYHDIGKTVRPYFFTENIAEGASPHEELDPLTSAQIIISHVTDGLDLAEKYHLPPRIRDFIREHHGTSLVKYFYVQACNQAEEGETVDEQAFHYPGPRPRSKETALLLLADTCEAAVRAMRPASRSELQQLINRLIDERVSQGELDRCNLTFKELQTTKEVFLRVLEGVHHPRVSYPELAQKQARLESPAPSEEEPEPHEPEASVPINT